MPGERSERKSLGTGAPLEAATAPARPSSSTRRGGSVGSAARLLEAATAPARPSSSTRRGESVGSAARLPEDRDRGGPQSHFGGALKAGESSFLGSKCSLVAPEPRETKTVIRCRARGVSPSSS
ncbi:unnamed protein product [Hapterophycus canaliculatus]